MAHELEMESGTASMLYAEEGGTPWHKLGTPVPVDSPARYDIERAIDVARLGFEVELWPLRAVSPLPGEGTLETNAFATVRTDKREVLGIVGADYRVLQAREAFAPFQPLLDADVCAIETAGVLRNGRDIWMLVKFNDDLFEFDAFKGTEPYGLIANNHSGTRAVDLALTRIRAVCANTLGAIQRGETFKVYHVGNVADRVREEAERIFENTKRRYAVLAQQFAVMQERELSDTQFRKLVLDVATPLKKHPETGKITSTQRTLDRREAIRNAWLGGIGHTGDPTAWWAYNGLVEVLDHSPLYQPPKRTRIESMMRGQIATVKSRVLAGLLPSQN